MNSSVYQSLKSQFSVLYQQADILKRQAEDARQAHENMRTVRIFPMKKMDQNIRSSWNNLNKWSWKSFNAKIKYAKS